MPQAIKYESTTIAPQRSAEHIRELIESYGARRFTLSYASDGRIEGVEFWLVDPDLGPSKPVPIRLLAKTERIFDILKRAALERQRNRYTRKPWSEMEREIREKSDRIAWRQLNDFIEQALLAAKTGLFSTGSAFMAHVLLDTAEGQTTLGEYFARHVSEVSDVGVRIGPARGEPVLIEGSGG